MQQYQWKGQKPQRFSGGRKHIGPQDQLGPHMQPALSTIGACGIRTFQNRNSKQYTFKSHSKIFPHHYELSKNQIDPRGKKCTQPAEQKQRIRPQKAHIPGGMQTDAQFVNRGIKSFGNSNSLSQNQYHVQNIMQKKAKIPSYEEQRNFIGTSALGDKSYKYPQYAPNFYHPGGLVPGSTFRPMAEKQKQLQKNKNISVFTKPNWDVRVKQEQAAEQKRVVNAVDEWQQTILKQANPNWNDPDTFFQRMEAKKQVKDPKKGGKK